MWEASKLSVLLVQKLSVIMCFLLNNTGRIFKNLMQHWGEKAELVSPCQVSLIPPCFQEASSVNLQMRHQTCVIFMTGSQSFVKILLPCIYAFKFHATWWCELRATRSIVITFSRCYKWEWEPGLLWLLHYCLCFAIGLNSLQQFVAFVLIILRFWAETVYEMIFVYFFKMFFWLLCLVLLLHDDVLPV